MGQFRILKTKRSNYYTRTTVGKLYVENNYFGFTLEDTVRAFGIKIFGETAISQNMTNGYKLGIHHSNHFDRDVLIIYTEDDGKTLKHGGISFEYIYFHTLNNHLQSKGCTGIAKNHIGNKIQGTLEQELFDLVAPWIRAGDDVRYFIENMPQLK